MGYRANYHTHTYRCGHASGEASDYARVALESGMSLLGFSDHTPLPDGRWSDFRMASRELDGYVDAVRTAASRYPALEVLLGMECEWLPEFKGFYEDELLGAREFDYLIGACHLTQVDGRWQGSFDHTSTPVALRAYAKLCVATMESGLFAFIAHPDLFGSCNPVWNPDTAACAHEICTASVALGVPLEINGLGFRKSLIPGEQGPRPPYPWTPFWEVAAACGVQVVLNSDAHHPEDVAANYPDVAAVRDRFQLVEADLGL